MAQMFKFTINKNRCVNCRNCELFGPEIFREEKVDGLIISAEYMEKYNQEIEKALDKCFLDALTFTKV